VQDLTLKQHKAQSGSDGAAAAAAVVARLQFRRLLLQALIRIKRRQKQDLDQAAKLLLKAQVICYVPTHLALSGSGCSVEVLLGCHATFVVFMLALLLIAEEVYLSSHPHQAAPEAGP
jgi:hypothetical protein